MLTDCEFLLLELRRGPRDAMQVISAAIRERGVGLTVHSRVAELRGRGYVIECEISGKVPRTNRDRYLYRLVSEPDASPSVGTVTGGTHDDGEVSPASPGAPALGEQLELIA